MHQKMRRQKKRIISLKEVVKDLTRRNLLTSENCVLLESMSDISKELQKRKVGKKVKYSPELRKFAITLSFFSPKGYDYVRKVFDTCLPHRSTIGKWFRSINADPGFTSESFNVLKNHVQFSNKPIILSLIIDEMSVRKHIDWDGKKFHGYVNYGTDLEDDSNSVAKEAFVLMVVNINGTWKLPVGYFLVDGLNGTQKSALVSQCLRLVSETGAHVVSLTFDGAPSNIAMVNNLGANTNVQVLKTDFCINGDTIFIFYDPSHMLKLIRNTFGDKKVLVDGTGNFIKWEYIVKLVQLQESEGLHLGNKVRKAHIHFFKQKMKVRLAVQLLSASVADALAYCEEQLHLSQFKGCQATIKFINIINNCFDILNSRSLVSPGYKKSLCKKNIDNTKTFIENAIKYFTELKFIDGELLINSKRKTGFVGLIVSLKSALSLYDSLVVDRGQLQYLPLYKISQDHLELYFSSIRSRGGWNNNPTARQFAAAYKWLTVRAEVRQGGVGNCIPLEEIPILTESSRLKSPEENLNFTSPHLLHEEVLVPPPLESIWGDHDYIMNTDVLSNCSLQIIIYIAGFVTYQLKKSIQCEHCIQAIIGDKDDFLNSLINKKNRGGLTYPSKDVVNICKISEHFLRVNENLLMKTNFVDQLKNKVMFECIQLELFNSLAEHVLNVGINHIYFLIESVISKYFTIRIHFITKRKSEITDPVRNFLTKTILFKGQ